MDLVLSRKPSATVKSIKTNPFRLHAPLFQFQLHGLRYASIKSAGSINHPDTRIIILGYGQEPGLYGGCESEYLTLTIAVHASPSWASPRLSRFHVMRSDAFLLGGMELTFGLFRFHLRSLRSSFSQNPKSSVLSEIWNSRWNEWMIFWEIYDSRE